MCRKLQTMHGLVELGARGLGFLFDINGKALDLVPGGEEAIF
jgi:hypothetical protein